MNVINYCDLYVHPSYAEIESIACVEAITCGLVPVIANSEMSAARFFALTEDNLYVSGDTDSLADKIDHMIENPELREELKRRPTLWTYEKLAQMRLSANPQDEELKLLTSLLKPYVNNPGRYRCAHCGFQAKGFQWLCPGCSSWGSYSPKRQAE